MSRLIATLMAAAMLMPTAASAQDRNDGPGGPRDRGPRADGPRADAPRDMGEARQRPWRDQMQPVDRPGPGPGADDPRRQYDRGRDDRRRDDRGYAGRDTDGRGNDGRGNDGRNNDGRWNDGRRDGLDRNVAGLPRPGRNPDRFVDPRRDGDRRYDAGRYDDRNRWDDRRGDRWYSDRDDGNRGGWNRGWRRDDRYDWTRYRTTHRDAYRLPRYYAPSGWGGGYRRFGVGVTLSSGLWGRNYWIADPYAYRLPEAYGPFRWVRYYGDALLIDVRTGLVVDTVYDIFW